MQKKEDEEKVVRCDNDTKEKNTNLYSGWREGDGLITQ